MSFSFTRGANNSIKYYASLGRKKIYIYNLNCIQNNIGKTLTRIENMCYQRER